VILITPITMATAPPRLASVESVGI